MSKQVGSSLCLPCDEQQGGVAKVIGLSKLRTKYESFESKRELCKLYDLFLADDRILPSLPKLIGELVANHHCSITTGAEGVSASRGQEHDYSSTRPRLLTYMPGRQRHKASRITCTSIGACRQEVLPEEEAAHPHPPDS
jgi:hypothetical protein